MPEPKRTAHAALDAVSANLAEVLRRADELLVEWSTFGASVRAQVDREAAAVGDAVAGAVDGAVTRAVVTGIDRTMADQIGARMASLTTELAKLEHRARTAARAVADERTGDRRVLWVIAAGVLVANALLVAVLLRGPAEPARPFAEPARVESLAPAQPTDGTAELPIAGETAGGAGAESADPASGSAAGSAATPADPATVPAAGGETESGAKARPAAGGQAGSSARTPHGKAAPGAGGAATPAVDAAPGGASGSKPPAGHKQRAGARPPKTAGARAPGRHKNVLPPRRK